MGFYSDSTTLVQSPDLVRGFSTIPFESQNIMSDYIELNMQNYDECQIEQLNNWAIETADTITILSNLTSQLIKGDIKATTLDLSKIRIGTTTYSRELLLFIDEQHDEVDFYAAIRTAGYGTELLEVEDVIYNDDFCFYSVMIAGDRYLVDFSGVTVCILDEDTHVHLCSL